MTPSSIISGIPPTSDATTGRDSAIASRIERPCASRCDGRTATSNDAVTAGMSSRRPGEDDAVGDPVRGRALLERVAQRSLADDHQVRVGNLAQDVRPGIDQRLVALLGLEPRDDADDLRPGLHPELVAERRMFGSWWS